MTLQEKTFIEFLRDAYSIVVIYNPFGGYSIFVIEDFKPYNPSNHQHFTEIYGRDVTEIVKDFGVVASANMQVIRSIETRISELPLIKNTYSNHYQYEWFRR